MSDPDELPESSHVDPWAAHSAGLFEECGKAVLFRHAPDRYRKVLAAAEDDEALLLLEHDAFGVSHDALGAALCETWGLAPAAVRALVERAVERPTFGFLGEPHVNVLLLNRQLDRAAVNRQLDLLGATPAR